MQHNHITNLHSFIERSEQRMKDRLKDAHYKGEEFETQTEILLQKIEKDLKGKRVIELEKQKKLFNEFKEMANHMLLGKEEMKKVCYKM